MYEHMYCAGNYDWVEPDANCAQHLIRWPARRIRKIRSLSRSATSSAPLRATYPEMHEREVLSRPERRVESYSRRE